MKVLELFAGTRSIGKAFEAHGHQVFSVEWDKSFENIDLYEDVLKVTPEEIVKRFGRPDVIHADDDRVVRCDCFRPIPEELKEGEGT